MKEKFNKRKLFVPLAAALLVLSLSCVSYAWIILQRSSGRFGFKTGELSNTLVELATVESGMSESERAYKTLTAPKLDLDAPSAGQDGSFEMFLSDMSFGSIDNLTLHKAENIVYLRISVPKSMGSNVKIKLSHYNGDDAYYFDIYKNILDAAGTALGTQEKVSDSTMLDALLAVSEGGAANALPSEKYLRFSCAVSDVAYQANEIEAASKTEGGLSFGEYTDVVLEKDGVTITPTELVSPESVSGESYYIYIRLEPNLHAFAQSVEHIATIMPCFMLFRIKLEFEILTAELS